MVVYIEAYAVNYSDFTVFAHFNDNFDFKQFTNNTLLMFWFDFYMKSKRNSSGLNAYLFRCCVL